MYTQLYLQWITNKDLLFSTWKSLQCYVATRMEGEFGGEWIHVWYGRFPLLSTALLISYTAMQN